MRYAACFLAGLIGLLGLLFLVAAGQGNAAPRIAIGVVCLLASGALGYLAWFASASKRPVQQLKLDLSGDVSLERMTCRECGAGLGEQALSVKAGAVFVRCEYCGAEYQLEEAPKW